MKHSLLAATAAIALGIGFPAHATLQIAANVNGTTITCADQAACDTNAAVGQLTLANQTIAGVQFLGSAQTQVIGPTNSLNTSSFQFINNNGTPATVQLAVSGTSFQGPVAAFSASGSGTFQTAVGSTIDLTFFADGANTQGATTPTDLPGTKLADNGGFTATLPTDSFNFNDNGSFTAAGLYSMALGTVGTLTPGGSLVGRSQAIVTEEVPVSEPGSLALLGAGLVGTGLVMRRRRRGVAALP